MPLLNESQLASFSAWYSLYPRKVARKAAEKAWARIATSPEVIEQIMAGLRAQLQTMSLKDKQFIPHPATWLRGKRWEDSSLEFSQRDKPRVIACEKCGDTGVVILSLRIPDKEEPLLGSCSCKAGQLPGVLAGVSE